MLRRRSANVIIVVTLVIFVILFIVTAESGSVRPINFTAAFNLYAVFFYSFCSLSQCPFWAQKGRKTPGTDKISHNSLLLRSCKQHPSIGCCLPFTAFVQASGAKELAFHALTATHSASLKHHLPYFRCLNGCSLLLPCEVAITRYSPSKLGSTLALSQLLDSAGFSLTLPLYA